MLGPLFDLGGTFLRAGLAGDDGLLYSCSKTKICSVADGLPPDEIWERILCSILAYVNRQESLISVDSPIVISFPGPIGKNHEILQAPTVAGSGLSAFDLPAAVASATGRRVVVLNDVSAAAWRVAEKASVRRFAVVTVSSGIGSKIFDRCHASGVLDQPAYSGEIGHVVVDDSLDAPICDCGGKGHLGAIASGRGIERTVRRRALCEPQEFHNSLLTRRFGATFDDLNNEQHIVPAVRARDPWSSRIFYDSTRPLVRSLLMVLMAAGLEKVFFIGGFVNQMAERYLEIVHALAEELSQYQIVQSCLSDLFELVPTHQETCLEGCAAYLRAKAV